MQGLCRTDGEDHRLEKACNPVLESEREARVSHWAGSCHPQTHAACKMPALEPGPLPALPFLGGFWRLRPAIPISVPRGCHSTWPLPEEGNARGWRSGRWAGVLALPPPPGSPCQATALVGACLLLGKGGTR